MTSRERNFLSIGLGIGAWIVPAATILAARYAGRHFLDVITKEQT